MSCRLDARTLVGLAAFVVSFCALPSHALAQPVPAQPGPPVVPRPPQAVTPSLGIDPDQLGATPHWTITIGAQYCGGFRIGDGVYVSPEAPLALPSTLPDGSVLFDGQPASVDWVNGALRVGPGQGLARSMICMAGDRPLSVELLPQAAFGLPADPGDYAVDVWTGANPTPLNLVFTAPAADQPPATD